MNFHRMKLDQTSRNEIMGSIYDRARLRGRFKNFTNGDELKKNNKQIKNRQTRHYDQKCHFRRMFFFKGEGETQEES